MNRPPIGFIVEGHGEYNCYPSLLCRILERNGFKIPRINAGGCGSVLKRLPEHLTDLLTTDSPEYVVVTVDLIDVVCQGLASDLEDLINKMNLEVSLWFDSATKNPRIQPLPEKIFCLAQVRKFESWIIADIEGLRSANLVWALTESVNDAESIENPDAWLRNALTCERTLKNPAFARTVVTAIDPSRMKLHSASFSLFYDQCKSAYSMWERRIVDAAAAGY